jgi:hypothetical protein
MPLAVLRIPCISYSKPPERLGFNSEGNREQAPPAYSRGPKVFSTFCAFSVSLMRGKTFSTKN